MKSAAALCLAVCALAAAAPARAAPYRIDRLHDHEDRIQDAVDQRRLPARAGRELTRVRELEQRMRARHGSNLTAFDFHVLEGRLDAIDGRRAHGRRRPATITTTTTVVRR